MLFLHSPEETPHNCGFIMTQSHAGKRILSDDLQMNNIGLFRSDIRAYFHNTMRVYCLKVYYKHHKFGL